MVQGHARLRESGLGAELTWDTKQSASLEGQGTCGAIQGIDGPLIDLARE